MTENPSRFSGRLAGLTLLLTLSTSLQAQMADGDALEAPPPPPPINADELIEPEVTITETEQERITEYRVRGRVYMVRVEPIAGPPYFLYDSDGDGLLDLQRHDPRSLAVPQWRLFSW